MSLYESSDSKGTISLKRLFGEKDYVFFNENKGYSLEDTAFFVCRGGWPQSIVEDREMTLEIAKKHYEGLFNFRSGENREIRNKRPEFFKNVLKSYARNISSQA